MASDSSVTLARRDLDAYCCVDLIRAEADKRIVTASGGVWLGYAEGCLTHLPLMRFCPFCGAQIISTNYEGGGWSWRTEKRTGASGV